MGNSIREELAALVRGIADKLEDSDALLKQWADENGFDYDEDRDAYSDAEGETYGIYDLECEHGSLATYFMEEVLDMKTVVSLGYSVEIQEVELAVTLGGPNIYVDAMAGRVRGYWGSEHYAYAYQDGIGLAEYAEDLANDQLANFQRA